LHHFCGGIGVGIGVDVGIGSIGVGDGIATPAAWQRAQALDSPGVGGFLTVVRCGIVGVALAGQQWQAVAVERESGCGSGGRAMALLGQQWHNTCTAALLGWEGGGGRAEVLVRRQQGHSGPEG
jgi:hypothetical protein